MKKQVDKSKITIVILSIVFALSMSVTVILAAFSANKTGDLTLTFADGLTMTIDPKNAGSSWVKLSSAADEDATTFSWPVKTGQLAGLRYDGVSATLNKPAWVGYKIELRETTSGAATLTGSWRYIQNANNEKIYFEPTGSKTDWRFTIYVLTNTSYTFSTGSGVIFTAISTAKWDTSNLTQDIFQSWEIVGRADYRYINDLANRSFEILFTVKAQTDQAPTFS